jgi:hypothetical protein
MTAHGMEVLRANSDAQGFEDLRRAGSRAQMIILIGAYSSFAKEWPTTSRLRHDSFNRLGVVAVEVG